MCSSMRCDCDPFPASYLACHPQLGCVTGMDCSAACERDIEGTCAYSVGLGRGECTDGLLDSFCVTSQQCQQGYCYTGGNSAGTCIKGGTGQTCDAEIDCESGVCASGACE